MKMKYTIFIVIGAFVAGGLGVYAYMSYQQADPEPDEMSVEISDVEDEDIEDEDTGEEAQRVYMPNTGFSFEWPFEHTLSSSVDGQGRTSHIVSLYQDLREPAVTEVACGSRGFYEGPYETQRVTEKERTFTHGGKEYQIVLEEHESYRYDSEQRKNLPTTGTPTIVLIDVRPVHSTSISTGLTWGPDICIARIRGELNSDGYLEGLTAEQRALMQTIYATWR